MGCWGACWGAGVGAGVHVMVLGCVLGVPRCVQWCPGAKLCRTPLRIADPHPFPNNPLGPLPAHAASRGGLRAGRAGGNPLAALPCTYCCGFGVWLGLVPLQEAAARVFAWRGSASARQRAPAREGFGVVCQGSGFLFFFTFLRGFSTHWAMEKHLFGFLCWQHAGKQLACCNSTEELHSVPQSVRVPV